MLTVITAHVHSTTGGYVFSLSTTWGRGEVPHLLPIILPMVPCPFWGYPSPSWGYPSPGYWVPHPRRGYPVLARGYARPSQVRMGYPPGSAYAWTGYAAGRTSVAVSLCWAISGCGISIKIVSFPKWFPQRING